MGARFCVFGCGREAGENMRQGLCGLQFAGGGAGHGGCRRGRGFTSAPAQVRLRRHGGVQGSVLQQRETPGVAREGAAAGWIYVRDVQEVRAGR